jgi:hypothetical protein
VTVSAFVRISNGSSSLFWIGVRPMAHMPQARGRDYVFVRIRHQRARFYGFSTFAGLTRINDEANVSLEQAEMEDRHQTARLRCSRPVSRSGGFWRAGWSGPRHSYRRRTQDRQVGLPRSRPWLKQVEVNHEDNYPFRRNCCASLKKKDKHRAQDRTNAESRFGQKPIPKAGGRDYRVRNPRNACANRLKDMGKSRPRCER